MESIDVQKFRPLAEDHITECMALSAEAGWNQTPEDWTLFFRHGLVLGFPSRSGMVASGAILPYPDDFAWISMVLVTAPQRHQRIGTSMLEACCVEVARRGLVAVLDATPAGERIYRPLGFEGLFAFSRWQGFTHGRANPPAGIRAMAAGDIPTVVAIDAAAFGAQRKFLVESLFRRHPQLAFVTQDRTGFVLGRPGRLATQIGPIVAANEVAAAALLDAVLGCVNGPVFLDLVDRWEILMRHLRLRGFTLQRPFLRMALNCRVPFGDPAQLFIVAGPEFG